MGCILAAIIYLACFGISWVITCGLIWLITLCFNLVFSWATATGIWLVLLILTGLFASGSRK